MAMTEKPLWINLGCSDDIKPNFLNVDMVANVPGVHPLDLRKNWPWHSNASYILARDIIEHLPDKIHTMNQAWESLKAGGIIEIEVPTTDGNGAFQDPTHVSYWNRHSFWYFEDGNIYRERFAQSYGIVARFKVVSEQMQNTMDGPKLTIRLEAVK